MLTCFLIVLDIDLAIAGLQSALCIPWKLGSGTDLYPVTPLFRLLLLLLLQLLRLLLLSWVMLLVTMLTQETLVTRQQGGHQASSQVTRRVGQLGHGCPDIRGAKLEKQKLLHTYINSVQNEVFSARSD